MVFIALLSTILIVCVWLFADVGLGAKLLLTVLYAASWTLLYWNTGALAAGHAVLSIIFGAVTFGVDWLNQRMH